MRVAALRSSYSDGLNPVAADNDRRRIFGLKARQPPSSVAFDNPVGAHKNLTNLRL
jgi:hypothetical protein